MQKRPTTGRRGSEPAWTPSPGSAEAGIAGAEQDTQSSPEGRSRTRRLRRPQVKGALALRNWRVRTRLLAVILIPIIAALLLGGLRIGSAVQSATEYERVRTLARLAEKTTALAHDLENERDLIAQHIANSRNGDVQQLTAQRATVEQSVAGFKARAEAVDDSYGPLISNKLEAVTHQLGTLDALRNSALTSRLPALPTINAYTAIISDLLGIDVEISGTGNSRQLSEKARTLDAFSRAKERSSRQRAILSASLTAKKFQRDEFNGLLFASEQQEAALQDFEAVAKPEQREMFEDTVTGTDVDLAEQIRQTAIARQGSADLSKGAEEWFTAESWFTAMSNKLDLMRIVESRLVDSLLVESADLQTEAERAALLVSLLVLLILVLALGATLVVAQSMVGPLNTLRASAQDVAERRLPEVVRLLRRADGTKLEDMGVERTNIDSKDEIGEVARAFDEVHSEAVRLAAEQAMLRSSVNAMFVNLSRRTQSLVERQLRLIDDLETSEQDPDQLSSLFKLDHLATRMRRNGENLLVLAGEEAGRRWSAPVPLVDVIRAATSEVEQYERIQLRGLPAADIAGRAVNDVVHLIAELLENATSFSSPETRVLVTSQLLSGGGAMVEIEDSGIGMTVKELEDANARLLEPPVVDVSVARRMGLFVVGRLAERHGIRVQLRKSSSGGITALVMLPEDLVLDHTASTPQQGQRDQSRQPASLFEPQQKSGSQAISPVQGTPPAPLRPAPAQPGRAIPAGPRAGAGSGAGPGSRGPNGAPGEPPAALPPFGPVTPSKAPAPIPRQGQPIRALGSSELPQDQPAEDEAGDDVLRPDASRSEGSGPETGDIWRSGRRSEPLPPAPERPALGDGRPGSPEREQAPQAWASRDDTGQTEAGRADRDRAAQGWSEPPRQEPVDDWRAAEPGADRRRTESRAEPFSWDDLGRDEESRPDTPRSGSSRPEPVRPDSARNEPPRPEPARYEPQRPEPARYEPPRPEPPSAEPPLPRRPRPEPVGFEPSGPDSPGGSRPPVQPRYVPPGGEPARPEPVQPDAARDEPAWAEEPRYSPPRYELERDEASQREPSQDEPSRYEPSRFERFEREPDRPAAPSWDQTDQGLPDALSSSGSLARLNGDDRLPIFEAVESEWFRRRTSRRYAPTPPRPEPVPSEEQDSRQPADEADDDRTAATAPAGTTAPTGAAGADVAPAGATGPGAEPEAEEEREWRSPGDEAWRAAESIRKPATAGLTPAGLPIRIPKAHFVPGSAGKPTLPTPTRTAARSPEAVRGRLASFHQGVRQGRDAGRSSGEQNRSTAPSNQQEENQ